MEPKPVQKRGTVWVYLTQPLAEEFEGPFATEKEAIDHARARESDMDLDDRNIYVQPGYWVQPEDLFSVEGFVETAVDNLEDLGDEDARDHLHVSTEAVGELAGFVKDWLKRHVVCTAFALDGPIRQVHLGDDDP